MRAIILAAGRGSRLKNLTKNKPKCLVKVKNKTLLSSVIKNFKKNNIDKICLITGYSSKSIKNKSALKINNNIWNKTNMLYSLSLADKWLSKHTCIISYSDIFYDKEVIEILKKDNNDFSIVSINNWKKIWNIRFANPLNDLESFKLDKNDYLKEIGLKVHKLEAIEGQYSGIFKIKPKMWIRIKKELKKLKINKFHSLDMTKLFQILIKKKFKIKILKFNKNWFEFDSQKDLKVYEKFSKLNNI
tara:strand:- start:13 stop:747 length:735 start_codon:yes stop_codon:yes gene_type:complete